MKSTTGFTLIELLVVISIIGILASIVLGSLENATTKAQDAHRESDINQISTALTLFYDAYGRMPKNYNNFGTGYNPGGGGNTGACDAAVTGVPGTGTNNFVPAAYNASMQELVTAGFLPSIIHSTGDQGYCYYDFGTGNTVGGLIMTELEASQNTTTGISPSCRPWTSDGLTWCETQNSEEYCMCNPYN